MDQIYKVAGSVMYKGLPYLAKKRDDGESTFKSSIAPDIATNDWHQEPIGKVLILCQYTDSIVSLYKRLPEKYLQKTAKIYKGNSAKQNKLNLNSFLKRGKGIEIVICQADRVSEGFNAQAAARIIRVECPWTPGAIEQSNARVFRPAVGADRREFVYLDWIVTDATLEVVKVGKLYNRTVSNCQYEESDNKDGENGKNLYEGIMNVVERPWKLNKKTLGARDGQHPLFSQLQEERKDPTTGIIIPEITMHTYETVL